MKLKKVLAFGLVATMMASMAIGVSATSGTTIRDAVSGDGTPATGSADVEVEGIIEPTKNTSSGMLLPTDPSKTSDASSGWIDPIVDDTSQLLVSAPAKMKFVVRGQGTAYGSAGLVGAETVSGTIYNASAYIPADDGTVIPKKVEVKVSSITPTGTAQFNLYPNTANQAAMETLNGLKGSVQGVDIKLGNNAATDFATADNTSLGMLLEGALTSENGVFESSNTIAFVQNADMRTYFADDQTGRLVNNYNMGLTFSYVR